MMELFVKKLTELRFAEEVFHNVETVVYLLLVLQWKYHPPAQHSAAHRRHSVVDDVKQ